MSTQERAEASQTESDQKHPGATESELQPGIVPEVATLTWTIRLFESEPSKRVVVATVALIAASVGWLLFQSAIYAILAFVAVMASTSEFWVPLKYELSTKSASVRCGFSVTAIEWSEVRRVVLSREGWKLSPHAAEGRLSPFRGVYLRFGPEAESVQDFVRRHVNDDVRFVELGPDAGRGREASSEGGGRDSKTEDGEPRDPGAGDA